STRIRAILRGTITGRVQIGNLTADSRIKPGEQVVTSGGDKVYPRGLPVGTVESIAADPDHQPYSAIVVRPAVDLDRLEEVLVITGTQSDLPPGTQQDLTAGEAQHAADIRAGQPPGIDDDDPAAAAGNEAGATPPGAASAPATAPGVSAPHPLPSIHPDRYSSGTTPPASDLTPGGQNSAPPMAVQEGAAAGKTHHATSQDAGKPAAKRSETQPTSPH
ncbi:MAG TPA: rod shape-determining protein MreC, partial [Acidobacteriaceae bacterium]|nr:rod shape-determining protein MreC [Acidobacteriaceae bacterium]